MALFLVKQIVLKSQKGWNVPGEECLAAETIARFVVGLKKTAQEKELKAIFSNLSKLEKEIIKI